MLGFEFHPEASAEYDDAVDYYRQINLLLAQAFVLEIEHGIGMICKHPDRAGGYYSGNVKGVVKKPVFPSAIMFQTAIY